MSKPLRVLSIIGTRPEAVKMAPLLLEMERRPDRFCSVVCATAQHREMLDQVISTFRFHVDYDLNIMTTNQNLPDLTSAIIPSVSKIICQVNPDIVLVQGDTTTTMAASLAAFYCRVAVGHVEAGLRTKDLINPYPEEANRLVTDQLSTYCFAPTKKNQENLLKEGIPSHRIFVTGNPAIDALLLVRDQLIHRDPGEWDPCWGSARDVILNENSKLILVTAHRRESFGKGMFSIFTAIRKLASIFPDYHFVYPVHFNPNVRIPANKMLRGIQNVHLIDPLDYVPFVYLMSRSYLILTDSGGIQEEAPSLKKPVVVLREKTERQEAIEAGTAVLAGVYEDKIVELVTRFIEDESFYRRAVVCQNPFGDGTSAKKILQILENHYLDPRSKF